MNTSIPRYCYFIPPDGFVEGEGYRASVVFENCPGHSPTGDWPVGPRGRRPYFWGDTLDVALEKAQIQNTRLALSEPDVLEILVSAGITQESEGLVGVAGGAVDRLGVRQPPNTDGSRAITIAKSSAIDACGDPNRCDTCVVMTPDQGREGAPATRAKPLHVQPTLRFAFAVEGRPTVLTKGAAYASVLVAAVEKRCTCYDGSNSYDDPSVRCGYHEAIVLREAAHPGDERNRVQRRLAALERLRAIHKAEDDSTIAAMDRPALDLSNMHEDDLHEILVAVDWHLAHGQHQSRRTRGRRTK